MTAPATGSRGPRGALVAVAGLVVVAVGIGLTLWITREPDETDAPAPPKPAEPPQPARRTAASRRLPRVKEEPQPEPDRTGLLLAAWNAATALMKAGKPSEALAKLAALRKSNPEFFADAARAKQLAAMEQAALAELERAAKSGTLAEVKRLGGLLADGLLDKALASRAAAIVTTSEKRAAAASGGTGPAGAIVGRVEVISDRERLAAHLFRFSGAGNPPATKSWVDDQLAAAAKRTAAIAAQTPAQPLPVPDAAEAEKRRLEQLEQLRQRDVIGLLDHLGGALAWLAIHQGSDGHFGADAAATACKALKHEPACVESSNEKYALAATGLAVLAFLDFRDQDVKRLFEPTLARGIRWLVTQQEADGSFKLPQGAGYSAAIALMALGQAAASSHDPELVSATTRGMTFYAAQSGINGGYRYSRGSDGDLSVTGWYAQAMESAVHAGVFPPPELRANLERFVGLVSSGEADFRYLPSDRGPSKSLAPVGMLTASILRPEAIAERGPAWRKSLAKNPPANVYSLYYTVRVAFLLDGKVEGAIRKSLDALVAGQRAKGPSAGMIPLEKDRWFGDKGGVVATAFATLTLEHSLYRR